MMLYKEAAVIATIAGKAYCANNLPTGFVPNSNVAFLLSTFTMLQKYEKKLIFAFYPK